MTIKELFLIIIVPLFLIVSGCSAYYPDMTGTVVDAETGTPIEGAVVLVEWTKRVGLGDYHTESVKVVEVVTDKYGSFKVSGLIKPFVEPPGMTVYKKGYVAWNNNFIFPSNERRKDFRWQSVSAIRVDRFKEGYSYDKHISFISGAISSTIAYDKKGKMREAFDWENDLAYDEVKKNYIKQR